VVNVWANPKEQSGTVPLLRATQIGLDIGICRSGGGSGFVSKAIAAWRVNLRRLLMRRFAAGGAGADEVGQ